MHKREEAPDREGPPSKKMRGREEWSRPMKFSQPVSELLETAFPNDVFVPNTFSPTREMLERAIKHGPATLSGLLCFVSPEKRFGVVNDPNDESDSLLHVAATKGAPGVVRILCKARAYVDQPNISEYSPLCTAISTPSGKRQETIVALLDCDADLNLRSNIEALTPLMIAVADANFETVKQLLEAKANPRHRGELISVTSAAAVRGDPRILKAVLEAKANPNATVQSSSSIRLRPLFRAVQSGMLQNVKLLFQYGGIALLQSLGPMSTQTIITGAMNMEWVEEECYDMQYLGVPRKYTKAGRRIRMLRLLNSTFCGPGRLSVFKTVLLCWNRAQYRRTEGSRAFSSIPVTVLRHVFELVGGPVDDSLGDGDVWGRYLSTVHTPDISLLKLFHGWRVAVQERDDAVYRNKEAMTFYIRRNTCCPTPHNKCANMYCAASRVDGDHSGCLCYFLRHGFLPDTGFIEQDSTEHRYPLTAAALNPTPVGRKMVQMLLDAGGSKIRPVAH